MARKHFLRPIGTVPFRTTLSVAGLVPDEAGIPHCTAHGLRKAGAARAAESGATINQLMAVFDWLTPAMAKIYTDKADRKRMLGQAVALLSEKRIFLTTPNVPPARVVVSHRRQALENVGQN